MTCPHGDHPSCCLDCLDGPPPERAVPAPQILQMAAQYPGTCPGCGDAIEVGEAILGQRGGPWCHAGCVD